MAQEHRLADLPPLAVGRFTRILFGLSTLGYGGWVFSETGAFVEAGLWGLLGLSFLLGGLLAIPGCELSALPNLLLPRERRFHFP